MGQEQEQEQTANKYMKRCLTCSAVRDMHIKTALRFHLAPVRMLSLGRQMTGTPGRDVGKEEPLFNAGGL